MKIGLIVPGFSADESDWCIPALLNLVRKLAGNHEVHVFALRYPHRPHTYPVCGATVHALGGADSAGLGRLPLLQRTLANIAGEHRRRHFDVLHGLWADEPGFLAVAAGHLLSVPAVVSVMGGELVGLPDISYGGQLSRFNRWLTRFALHGAARVTVGSSFLYRLARPHIPAGRLQQMPLGVDTGMFCPGRVPSMSLVEGEIKLLHVASLVPVKEQSMLLQALAGVVARAPGIHLHVVGDGLLRPDLERLARALGLAAHVTFHGAVPHDQLPDYYRAADLGVLSSRYESQGMVVLEAAACGRATVGTAVGLLPDLGPAAQVVPIGDARALGEVILSVVQDPKRKIELGQHARACVESGYSLTLTVDNVLTLYAEVFQNSEKR